MVGGKITGMPEIQRRGSGSASPGIIPQQARRLGKHFGIVMTPRIPFEAEVLKKENWVVRNAADPSNFNHLLTAIHHPGRRDPLKPVVVMIPGMMCNGNLFRLSWEDRNYKDLTHASSIVNVLAFEGYTVVLPHPRYAKWIYTRYAHEKLGVPNSFPRGVDFRKLVDDLDFYIDASISLAGAQRAVVAGFSLGGIELLNLLAFKKKLDRVDGVIFMGAPVEFGANRENLITAARLYEEIARFVPMRDYHALNIAARSAVALKNLVRGISDDPSPAIVKEVLRFVPFFSDLVNINSPDFNPETAIPLIFYVLESLPEEVLNELLFMVRRGELERPGTGEKYLNALCNAANVPPWLVIRGKEDRLVSQRSHELLLSALTYNNNFGWDATVPNAGHVDSVFSPIAADEIVKFLSEIS